MTSTISTEPKPRRRLLRFSFRAMLLAMLAFAVWIGWLTQAARDQARTVAETERMGGFVNYHWQEGSDYPQTPPGPEWLRQRLGRHVFDRATSVRFVHRGLANGRACALIADLKHVGHVSLNGSEELTGAGLRHLARLPKLKLLAIQASAIDDDGLVHLAAMPQLGTFVIGNSPITDAALRRCADCPRLTSLEIAGPGVTDAGLAHLAALPDLKKLALRDTALTDAGLRHLAALPQLSVLTISNAAITDAGVSSLEELSTLQVLEIGCVPISDACLPDLSTMTHLRALILKETKITREGVRQLRTLIDQKRVSWQP